MAPASWATEEHRRDRENQHQAARLVTLARGERRRVRALHRASEIAAALPTRGDIRRGATAAGLFTANLTNQDVFFGVGARCLLGNDAAGLVVALHRELVELDQNGRVLANERHELLDGEVQGDRGVNRHHVGHRLTPQHQRNLADDVAWTERRQHEGLAPFDANHRDLARCDEMQAGRDRPPRR